MRSTLAAAFSIALYASLGGIPLPAQMQNNTDKQMTCENGGYRSDGVRHCEMREQTLSSTGRLGVESHNGGIVVKGWQQGNVLVRARVESFADTPAAADLLATQVSVVSGGGEVHAIGPENLGNSGWSHNSWWSVSYEVFVPQTSDLSLQSHNGGVTISDVRGQIRFDVHNGAVSLKRLAGDVGGETHNGAIEVETMGSRWDGTQLEASTHNGAIRVSMPAGFSAHVLADADNGHIQSDFPITVTGNLRPRHLDTSIGSGGPLIHLATHNGQVTLHSGAAQ